MLNLYFIYNNTDLKYLPVNTYQRKYPQPNIDILGCVITLSRRGNKIWR